MAIDVVDVHGHVLADLAGARRSEFSAPTAEHDGAVPDGELRVADDAAGRARAETLGKSEGAAEPLNRSGHVLVHQNWDHCRTRGGAVQDHGVSASITSAHPNLTPSYTALRR